MAKIEKKGKKTKRIVIELDIKTWKALQLLRIERVCSFKSIILEAMVEYAERNSL